MELQKVLQISFNATNGDKVEEGDTVIYSSNGTCATSVAKFKGFSKRGALILESVLSGETYNVMPQTITELVIANHFNY